MTTTRQLLDQALAAYNYEYRVWLSTGDMPWNRDQAKRVGVLSTRCERLRRQLNAEKASARTTATAARHAAEVVA